jgi:1-acyl-sn-glycerol-3-phosphate acyltransferase
MNRRWHTSAAVAACRTGAPIVPFYIQGLPYNWGPLELLKAASRCFAGTQAFSFKIRLGPCIHPVAGETNYVELTERVRQAVLELAV